MHMLGMRAQTMEKHISLSMHPCPSVQTRAYLLTCMDASVTHPVPALLGRICTCTSDHTCMFACTGCSLQSAAKPTSWKSSCVFKKAHSNRRCRLVHKELHRVRSIRRVLHKSLRNSIDVASYYFCTYYIHCTASHVCKSSRRVEPFLGDLPNMLNKGPERE